jgi:hypothetical protein
VKSSSNGKRSHAKKTGRYPETAVSELYVDKNTMKTDFS